MRFQQLKAFLFVTILFSSQIIYGQLELTVRPLQKTNTFGIFVSVQKGYNPSNKILTGTGQVTLVLPKDVLIDQIESVHGNWGYFDLIRTPKENPSKSYLSIGLSGEFDNIFYKKNLETLLFTLSLRSDVKNEISLIDNDKDVFAQLPNSLKTNPGNELSAIDPANNMQVYQYVGNYLIPRKL